MKSFGEFSHDLQEKNVPNDPALWKKAIAKAKAKFDVYPSAYANAWAAKWYKGEGGTWSVQKESVELDEMKKSDGPFTIVAIKNNKVVKQFHSIEHHEIEDAIELVKTMTGMEGVKISVESKKGRIVHTEDVDESTTMLKTPHHIQKKKKTKKAGKKEEVEVHEEDEDKKPLMTWFAQFEKELKKSGGKYKDVDPTDMLKLYYKGIKPKVAAKQLTAGYDIAEASFADRMIVKQGRGPGSGVAKSTNIGLVLPKTPSMEKKIQAVLEKDSATRRKMSNLVVGREDREKEFVLYFKSAQGRNNFRKMMNS